MNQLDVPHPAFARRGEVSAPPRALSLSVQRRAPRSGALLALTVIAALVAAPLRPGVAAPLTAASAAPASTRAEARAQYQKGLAAYKAGRFAEAVAAFGEAHAKDPAPVLLFNIAQAHWKAGDDQLALSFYRQFLESRPRGKNRARAEARVAEIEARLRTEQARREEQVRQQEQSRQEQARQQEQYRQEQGRREQANLHQARLEQATRRLEQAAVQREQDAAAEREQSARARAAAAVAAGPSPVPPPGPGALTLTTADQSPRPIYRRPWFWVAAGAVGAAVVVTTLVARGDGDPWSCGVGCTTHTVK